MQQVSSDHQVLPVNGTREALFAFTQAMLDRQRSPLVLMPNPFYQIYEGAALLGGGEPVYLPCTDATGLQPDFDAVDESTWLRTQVLFICTPGNPTAPVEPVTTIHSLRLIARSSAAVIAAPEAETSS